MMVVMQKIGGTAEIFQNTLKVANVLVEETPFSLTTDELTFKIMDPSHVAMANLHLNKAGFNTWDVDGGAKFTVRNDEVTKVLGRFKATDDLTVGLNADNLSIVNGSRSFALHLLESISSETPLPKLNFNTSFSIDRDKLLSIIKDIEAVAGHIKIEATADAVVCVGKEDNQATISLDKDTVYDLNVKEASAGLFNIEFLSKFVSASKADRLKVEFSSKLPLKITANIADASYVEWYLAPRFEDSS